MKLMIVGVKRVKGLAKASGQPFDITRVLALVPIEAGGNEKFSAEGFGYELAEMALDESAMSSFSGVKFPATLDLLTETRPFRGRLEAVVVGFNPPATLKAASGS